MDTIEAIRKRSATRQFTDRHVKTGVLKKIVQVAEKTPTWINSQSGRIIIVSGNLLTKIRKNHQRLNQDPSQHAHPDLTYVPIRNWDPASQTAMKNKIKASHRQLGNRFSTISSQHKDHLYNAPAVVYLILPAGDPEWAVYDLGATGQSIMLAAYDLGVASLPAFEFVKYPDHLRKQLGINRNQKLIMGIGLGYRDPSDPINDIHPRRLPINKVLTFKS